MSISVLFMCPHSAGKSLAAATYFRAAAGRAGLDVEISVAGPDPDDVNMPTVTGALTKQGYVISWEPRLVTEKIAARATHVVNIGCDRNAIPSSRDVVEWDVPMLSEDFSRALGAIYDRSEALADILAKEGGTLGMS